MPLFETGKNRKKILVLTCFITAAVASGFFCFNIISLVFGSQEASANKPFLLKKPGEYTLFMPDMVPETSSPGKKNREEYERWTPRPQGDSTNQFELVFVDKSETIYSHPLFGTEDFQSDGNKYIGVCNFTVPSPGTYYIVIAGGYAIDHLMFGPAITIKIVVETPMAFFIGFLSSVIGFLLVFSSTILIVWNRRLL